MALTKPEESQLFPSPNVYPNEGRGNIKSFFSKSAFKIYLHSLSFYFLYAFSNSVSTIQATISFCWDILVTDSLFLIFSPFKAFSKWS